MLCQVARYKNRFELEYGYAVERVRIREKAKKRDKQTYLCVLKSKKATERWLFFAKSMVSR